MVPAPNTATVAPGVILASSVACQPVTNASGRRLASVHWGVAGRIVLAWSCTLPAAAAVGAAASWLAGTGTAGVIVVAVTGVAMASGIYAASRRDAVTADNVNDVRPPVAVEAQA